MADTQDTDYGREIMKLMVMELKRRLEIAPEELKAADFEMMRKLLSDNSITLASIRAGNFGDLAAQVASKYPDETAYPVQ